ncbi:MAG TPA: T9SS type A sorting domain-containing protein, partial [Saprospiraceae bacterium]|nr:T9SS type A sorting domain-containing protein [Saprospiraceae bacterium]
YSLCQTADGGFAILAILNIWTGSPDIAIIKIDSLGKTLWTKTYVDSHFKFGNQIIQTSDHGLAIGGGDTANNSDFYLLLTDSLGNLKWSRYYGANGSEGAYSLAQSSDNGFILAGNSNSFNGGDVDPCAIKINSSGGIDWCTSMETVNTGVAFSVIQSSDGGYILAGEDYELIKLDSNGDSPCSATKQIVTAKEATTIVSDISLFETSPNTITTNSVSVIRPEVDVTVVCNSVRTKNLFSSKYLEIVPNPAKDYFSIKSESFVNNALVEIYDILSNKVYSCTENVLENIDCHQLLSGVYVVRVKLGDAFYSLKLIVGR